MYRHELLIDRFSLFLYIWIMATWVKIIGCMQCV